MQLNVQKRTILGKKVSDLRDQDLIPAVIFGKGMESIPISVDRLDFEKLYKKAGETTVIEVQVGKEKFPSLITETQRDPVSLQIIHANFHKVDLSQKITASVPIIIVGEDECEPVKSGEGMALSLLDTLEIEALPSDLPKKIEVDVSGLQDVGDGIKVADLDIDKKKLTIKDREDEDLVVKIERAQMEEEVVEEEVVVEEAPAEEGVEEEAKKKEVGGIEEREVKEKAEEQQEKE